MESLDTKKRGSRAKGPIQQSARESRTAIKEFSMARGGGDSGGVREKTKRSERAREEKAGGGGIH